MHLPLAVHRHPGPRRHHRDVQLRQLLTRLRVTNRTRGTTLATDCRVAADPIRRALGLLPRSSLPEGEALLLTRTNAITMWLMRFPIDAVWLDGAGRVVGVRERLRPWSFAARARAARDVLELPAGTIARTATQVGDDVLCEPIG